MLRRFEGQVIIEVGHPAGDLRRPRVGGRSRVPPGRYPVSQNAREFVGASRH